MKTILKSIIPVLSSANIERDVAWYKERFGFEIYFEDKMYAVLYRENICIHLQWHADTEEDPLLGGAVIRIYVENIHPLFDELLQKGLISSDKLRKDTPWKTNEFGFFDLNNNDVFVMEDLPQ